MVPSFSALQAFCQGDHDHEPWGQCAMAPNGWATSHETAYPWALCRSLAFALSDWLQQQGLIFPPLCFAQQEASLQTLRAATGTQSRKPLPPLVPEFAAILRHPADAPLPPLSRKLSTPRPGHFASEEIRKGEAEQVTETKEHITIGIHWAPEEFVAEAIRVGHPALLASNFPVEMIEANNFCASRTDYEVAKHRTEVVKRWLSLANDFSQAEATNKDSLSTRRRQVLEKKRLHLFDQLIREAGHSDTTLAECIRHGFDLTGKLPRSNFFEEKFRPASLPCETLRKSADLAREAMVLSCKSSGDPDLDAALHEVTRKEVAKGFLEGPVDLTCVPSGATLTKRFPVKQKNKVRPIDDYRASLVNSSVTQPEGVSVHTVDHVAGLVAHWFRSHLEHNKDCAAVAKTWDLRDAYKQVPLSDVAFELDSYIVVFNPKSQLAEIYKQRVLPFGSVASVTAFLRCSSAVWMIGAKLLKLVWSAYFDDFLSLTTPALSRHTDICISVMFQLLGWETSVEKLVPFNTCCKVLGVQLDLGQSVFGKALVSNTKDRSAELTDEIDSILACGRLKRHDGERLRGRLQFASGQLFGRKFRLLLSVLNRHVSRGWTQISDDLRQALVSIRSRLVSGLSRVIDSRYSDFVHIYVDASFCPGGYSGVGGVLYDSSGDAQNFFSFRVPDEWLASMSSEGAKVVIQELEGFAALLALREWLPSYPNRRFVLFTDSESIKGSLLKCASENAVCHRTVSWILDCQENASSSVWYERVPSESNPSDRLSREEVLSLGSAVRVDFNLQELWDDVLQSLVKG